MITRGRTKLARPARRCPGATVPRRRLAIEILVPERHLRAALRATDPHAPLSTFEEQCWLEDAVGQCLERGQYSLQAVRDDGAVVRVGTEPVVA